MLRSVRLRNSLPPPPSSLESPPDLETDAEKATRHDGNTSAHGGKISRDGCVNIGGIGGSGCSARYLGADTKQRSRKTSSILKRVRVPHVTKSRIYEVLSGRAGQNRAMPAELLAETRSRPCSEPERFARIAKERRPVPTEKTSARRARLL